MFICASHLASSLTQRQARLLKVTGSKQVMRELIMNHEQLRPSEKGRERVEPEDLAVLEVYALHTRCSSFREAS